MLAEDKGEMNIAGKGETINIIAPSFLCHMYICIFHLIHFVFLDYFSYHFKFQAIGYRILKWYATEIEAKEHHMEILDFELEEVTDKADGCLPFWVRLKIA